MLQDNIILLRNMHGYSQEEVAEKIDISRQAYAKWEKGDTIPDVEKCKALADLYGVTIDSLIKNNTIENVGLIPPVPKGKNIWGTVTVNERGQIVIPKQARDKFNLKSGDRIIVVSDEEGIALIKAEFFEERMREAIKYASIKHE